jgi:RNA polymerase sigma-70 factor (ECF subfamily)
MPANLSTQRSPETRRTLLVRVRDVQDGEAWAEFVALYAPLIHAYGRRRGLQEADAADLAQTVLCALARRLPGFAYDAAKGSFRGWLLNATRNELWKLLARQARTPSATGGSDFAQTLARQPDPQDDEQHWNREHEQQLFQWAAEKVRREFRSSTWDAFWRVAVAGESPAQAATALGLTTGAVYIARSRVVARLRQCVAEHRAAEG